MSSAVQSKGQIQWVTGRGLQVRDQIVNVGRVLNIASVSQVFLDVEVDDGCWNPDTGMIAWEKRLLRVHAADMIAVQRVHQ